MGPFDAVLLNALPLLKAILNLSKIYHTIDMIGVLSMLQNNSFPTLRIFDPFASLISLEKKKLLGVYFKRLCLPTQEQQRRENNKNYLQANESDNC